MIATMNTPSYEAKARQCQAEGKWAESLIQCQQAVEANPQDSKIYSLMGDILLNLQRWEESAEAYQKSLSIETRFDWAWHNLAFVLGQLDRWDEVHECHQKLSEIKPDFWQINGDMPMVKEQLAYYLDYLEAKEIGIDYRRGKIYRKNSREIESILKVSNRTYLVLVESDWSNQTDASVFSGSHQIEQPTTWTIEIANKSLLATLLTLDNTALIASIELVVVNKEAREKNVYKQTSGTKLTEDIKSLLSALSTDAQQIFFQHLSQHQIEHCDLSAISIHHYLYKKIYAQLFKESNIDLVLDYGCWLTPNVVYVEASVQKNWILGWSEVAVSSAKFFRVAQSYSFQIGDKKLASIIIFSEDVYIKQFQQYSFAFLEKDRQISLSDTVQSKSYNLEFIQHLNDKPEDQRYMIREALNYALIMKSHSRCRQQAIALVNKLQQYVLVVDRSPLNPELPFQIFFDRVIPIGHDGFFVVGWLHDPYKSLERIEVIPDLGFRFNISPEAIYRFERPDIKQHLDKNKYGNFSAKSGFCAYAKTDEFIRSKLANFASLHGVRFSIKLNSGISIEIVPKIKFCDDFTARSIVAQTVGPNQLTESMLSNCISPAIAKLQALCIEKVSIEEVVSIGALPNRPLVSIVIPIYERYDFQKVQIALFTNDPFLKEHCEVIYVLDSPWQKFDFSTFMQQHCKLYEFPVKVVFMERNSGYSSANNAGAQQAEGKYIVLMNSDVFPREKGWARKMMEFYQSSDKIGTVGGKLSYEDGSLQHAGMFFGKTTYPFWQNLHYFKGFPNSYAPAQSTRSVPAVTGACLMISRQLYRAVGGLSTEYVIGDFEDSDLCLKCLEKGYENWYYPEAEFYHLERQSVPLNDTYSQGLAWHHNARLHTQKWDVLISKVMAAHSI